jgi:hypothetical protein
MTIKTNNQPRDLLTVWDFSRKDQAKIREKFDWLEDIESDSTFFKYKGWIYNLSEFMAGGAKGWDGSKAESWSCGVLVKVSSDSEQVTCGWWSI